MSRLVLLLVVATGCIAAEPGKETQSAAQRRACTELEGLAFGSSAMQVAFAADDAEYSTYTVTAADGTQTLGLAQCTSMGNTSVIFIDGATDHWSAHSERLPGVTSVIWLDGRTLYVTEP